MWQQTNDSKWQTGVARAAMTREMSALFTPEERARLEALRERLGGAQDSVEQGLDACRLSFARWLVEHGKLSDDR